MAGLRRAAETGAVPDSSARIWVILGGLLLLTLMIVAVGLAAYGVFCFFDAKYHKV